MAVVAAVWLVVQLAIAMLPSGYPVTVEVRLQDARCSLVRVQTLRTLFCLVPAEHELDWCVAYVLFVLPYCFAENGPCPHGPHALPHCCRHREPTSCPWPHPHATWIHATDKGH